MRALAGRAWGPHALWLRLPALTVRLDGLSAAQRTSLARAYRPFLGDGPGAGGDNYVACRACRLVRPPPLTAAELTRGGLYAPRQRRMPAGLALTGINFEARVWEDGAPVPAQLGVVDPCALTQANVIDNVLRVLAAHRALRRGGVVLHSGGFVIDGAAWLFVARSGTGKTTLTRRARAHGAAVLSDDINLLLPVDGGYRAHAVPFTGELGRAPRADAPPGSYPLRGLVLLTRGPRLTSSPVTAAQALAGLLVNCPFVNDDATAAANLLDVLTDLVATVPVVRLACRRDDPLAAILATVRQGLAHAGPPCP